MKTIFGLCLSNSADTGKASSPVSSNCTIGGVIRAICRISPKSLSYPTS